MLNVKKLISFKGKNPIAVNQSQFQKNEIKSKKTSRILSIIKEQILSQKASSILNIKKLLPFKSMIPITMDEMFGLLSHSFEIDLKSKRMSRALLRVKNKLLTQKIPTRFLKQYEKLTMKVMKRDLIESGKIKGDRMLFLLLLLKSGEFNTCIRILEKIRGVITLNKGDQEAVIFVYKSISFLSMMMGAKNMPHEIRDFIISFSNKNRGFVGQVFARELERPAQALDLFIIGSSPFIRAHIDLVEEINFNSVIVAKPSPHAIEQFYHFFYYGMINKESMQNVASMITDWVWGSFFQTNRKIIESIGKDLDFPEEYRILSEMIKRIYF